MDENGNLLPLLERYWLTGAGKNVFQTRDQEQQHTRCYCYSTRTPGQYTSIFWIQTWHHLSITEMQSTAVHPPINGEAEWQDLIIQLYTLSASNYEQNNWVEWFPLARCVYNNSVSHSTWMTSSWLNYHSHPPIQFKLPKDPSNIRLGSWQMPWLHELRWLTDRSATGSWKPMYANQIAMVEKPKLRRQEHNVSVDWKLHTDWSVKESPRQVHWTEYSTQDHQSDWLQSRLA